MDHARASLSPRRSGGQMGRPSCDVVEARLFKAAVWPVSPSFCHSLLPSLPRRRPRVLRDQLSLLVSKPRVAVCAGSAEFSPRISSTCVRTFNCAPRRARTRYDAFSPSCSFHSLPSAHCVRALPEFQRRHPSSFIPCSVPFGHLYGPPALRLRLRDARLSVRACALFIITPRSMQREGDGDGGGDTGACASRVLPVAGWPADPASLSFAPPPSPCPCHCQPSLVQSPSFRYFSSSFPVIAIIVPLHSFLYVSPTPIAWCIH
jgi:hypothetical protein